VAHSNCEQASDTSANSRQAVPSRRRSPSVVGFDDIEIALFAGLTTVRQPLDESGRRGADLLLGLLGAEPQPASVKFPLELIRPRTTCRPRALGA
jgi:DNA-binding LacI/PurR family transcriptional regulator